MLAIGSGQDLLKKAGVPMALRDGGPDPELILSSAGAIDEEGLSPRSRSTVTSPARPTRRAYNVRSTRRRSKTTTIPVTGTALLLIDVVNDLAFPGSEVLVQQAEPMSTRLAAFKRRAAKAGVPIVYVNDNFGQWRSDFRRTVAHCCSQASPGRVVSRRLKPTAQDYFVLKPKHSGFYDTTLETLLSDLGITRVIVTGIAGNICVLFTANDAYMRGLRIYAPVDCIVSNTADDNEHALRQIEIVLKGRTEPSARLTFSRASGRGRRRR